MNIRMQMVRKMLYRGVEKLCGNDARACKNDECPPRGFRVNCDEHDQHKAKREDLKPQAALATHTLYEPCACEPQSREERLIFLSPHV